MNGRYYIYILWEEDSAYYKVGLSCNVKQRKIQIQNGNPHKLRLIFLAEMPDYDICLETEYGIKSRWEQCRVRPNCEWYIFDHKEVAATERFISKYAKK